jgi:hypothetical protein
MVSEDAVRDRAYFLWEADGRPDGRHDHYWGLAIAEATRTLDAMSAAHGDGKKPGKSAKAVSKSVPPAKSGKPKDAKPAKPAKLKSTAEAKPAKKATKPRAAVPKAK